MSQRDLAPKAVEHVPQQRSWASQALEKDTINANPCGIQLAKGAADEPHHPSEEGVSFWRGTLFGQSSKFAITVFDINPVFSQQSAAGS